jgi:hypothetical protein
MWGPLASTTFIVDRVPPVASASVLTYVRTPATSIALTAFDALTAATMSLHLRVERARGEGVVVEAGVPLQPPAADGTRVGSFTLTLSDGEYLVQATATDGAGNVGPPAMVNVTVDTLAPVVAPWHWPRATNANTSRVCVVVTDTAAQAGTVAGSLLLPGAVSRTTLPLVRDVGAGTPDAPVYCGTIVWGNLQGNGSVVVTASDPAGNQGQVSVWTIHDSVPPTHTAALVLGAASSVCVAKGDVDRVVVCRSAVGVVVAGDCDSGGVPGTSSASCAVQWTLSVLEVLQLGACGAAGASASNASAPLEGWVGLDQGAFSVNASSEVAVAVGAAGGNRVPVKLGLWTRAVDTAGEGGGGGWRGGLGG